MEQWKDIKGYEGYYQVSDQGRVKSLDRYIIQKNNVKTFKKGIILRQNIRTFNKTKYKRPEFALCKNAKCMTKIASRLVAIAFIPNPLNKAQVNHIDCNSLNNNVENLEWCSARENINHAIKNGRIKDHIERDDFKVIKDYLDGNKMSVVAKMNDITTSMVQHSLIRKKIPRRDKYEQRNKYGVDRKGIIKAYELGMTNKYIAEKFNESMIRINIEVNNHKKNIKEKELRGEK